MENFNTFERTATFDNIILIKMDDGYAIPTTELNTTSIILFHI